jgi:hypothetical protein
MMTAETTMTILLFVMFLCIATTIPVTIAKETATAETRSEQRATCTDATFENAKNDNGSKKQKGNSESWFDLLAQDPKLLFQKVLQDTATAAATAATSRSRSRPTKTTMSDTPSENENLFSKLEREHDTSSTNPKQQDFLQQLWTIFRNDDQQENERVLTDMLLQEKDHPNAHSTTAQILQLYGNSTDAVLQQLKDTFGDSVRLDRFDPLQVYYYMQHQEQVKNAVWKRQQHRYLPRLETSVAIQLADGLYLSHLSYVNTVLHVKEGLAAFKKIRGSCSLPRPIVSPINQPTLSPFTGNLLHYSSSINNNKMTRTKKTGGTLIALILIDKAKYSNKNRKRTCMWQL